MPTGWNDVNNITSEPIDKASYYMVQPGNPGDFLNTTSYDLSAYGTATFEVNIKSFGSGTHRSLKVEVSTDGGINYTQSFTTQVTTTTYTTQAVNIPIVSGNMLLRLSVASTSGRGIRLQNLVLTALGSASPTITTSSSFTSFDYTLGSGPSFEQTFTVEGNNLTNDIIVAPPTNYEISTTSGSGFGASITLNESSGIVSLTTIYVRLKSGLSVNLYSGSIIATSSGATDNSITISGNVNAISDNCLDENFDSFTEPLSGWSSSGLNNYTTVSSSGESPNSIKFDDSNDYLETPTLVSSAETLSFWIKGNSTNNNSLLLIEGWDGSSWSTVDKIKPLPTTGTIQTYNSGLSSFIKFKFTYTKGAGNLALDDLKITCACGPTQLVTSFTPISGPENTEVTINGTGFSPSSTVLFNGSIATVISQSSSELKVLVPSGASTGAITITEASCDFETSTDFTIIDTKNISCEGTVTADDLFISEVTDSTSGSLTYIEIYNGTGVDVSLSGYTIDVRFNAGATVQTINLSGTIVDGDVFVVRTTLNSTCSVSGGDGSYADQNTTKNGIDVGRNDSDCITLFNGSNDIDVWGDCSDDNWRENEGIAIGDEGFDFRRLITAMKPNTTFDHTDWEIIDWEDNSCNDDYSNIGEYSNGIPPYILSQSYDPPSCSDNAIITVNGYEGYNLTGDSQELEYQWYGVAPGATNWATLSDSGIYTGAGTKELTVSNTISVDGYQYYCQVREDDSDCYQATETVMITTTPNTSTWNGSVWSNGIPTSNTLVTLTSDYITSSNGNFSCCSLVLNVNVQLDIDGTDNYVSIENDLTVNDGAILNVENNTSLIMVYDYGDVTLNGTGIINVIKESTPYEKYDYTYWSTPIVGETIGRALSGSYVSMVYYYNGANYYDADGDGFDDDLNDWIQVGTNHVMDAGRGYAAMGSIGGTFAPSQVQSATFRGEVNNGIITEPVFINNSPTASEFDYNLVGNPYPSAINADEFILQNPDISGTIYFWTHIDNISISNPGPYDYNYKPDDYASYNLTGGVATSLSSGSGSNAPTGKIGSGQGFIVEAHNDGTVVFNNSMRNVNYSNSQFFRSENKKSIPKAEKVKDRMWVNLTNPDGAFNQALIGFFDEATDGYDSYYDGVFLGGGTYLSLYTLINGNAFNIQGKPTFKAADVIPLGFDSRISGPLTISLFETEGVLSKVPVYLKDKELQLIHNLKESDYVFEMAQAGTHNDRFEIVFQDAIVLSEQISIEEIEANSYKIIISNEPETILIQYINDAETKISNIRAYDILGRLFYDKETINNQISLPSSSIADGTVLIFKIELSNGLTYTQKFIKL